MRCKVTTINVMRQTFGAFFSVFGENFYSLFFRKFAHKKRIFVLCNDIAIKSLNHDLLLGGGVNDAIPRLIDVDIGSDEGVVGIVAGAEHVERSPGTDIAPSEVGRIDENLVGLPCYGVIDLGFLTQLLGLVGEFLPLFGAIIGQ